MIMEEQIVETAHTAGAQLVFYSQETVQKWQTWVASTNSVGIVREESTAVE
jgi:hypothetical protein